MEKKITSFIATAGLLLVLAVGLFLAGPRRSVAAQPEAPTNRLITVSGEGFLALKPEVVRLEILVANEPAAGANSLQPVERVTAALRSSGVSRDDIHTAAPALTPPGYGGQIGSATVLSAVLRDPSRLAELVKAVAGQGGQVLAARYQVSKPDQAQSQALNLALKDAQAKAKGLAGAVGGSVGKVQSIAAQQVGEEGGTVTMLSQLGAATGWAPGAGYGYRARVQVTYELR